MQNKVSHNAGHPARCRLGVISLADHMADVSCSWLPLPAITKERSTANGRPRKSPNFEVCFLLSVLCFQFMVQLKNSKLNHWKLGTVYDYKQWCQED
jgi:hypothetical protein